MRHYLCPGEPEMVSEQEKVSEPKTEWHAWKTKNPDDTRSPSLALKASLSQPASKHSLQHEHALGLPYVSTADEYVVWRIDPIGDAPIDGYVSQIAPTMEFGSLLRNRGGLAFRYSWCQFDMPIRKMRMALIEDANVTGHSSTVSTFRR